MNGDTRDGARGRDPLSLPPPRDPRPLVGRETELADAASLLRQCRVLTVTGAGGVGKTRFIQEFAWRMMPPTGDATGPSLDGPRFGRVIYVELESLQATDDDEEVYDELVKRVAGRLGFQDNGADPLDELVLRELRTDYPVLLVLDNCEHIVEAAATLVAQLHNECPCAKIVTTSQHPLHLAVEQWFRLNPLPAPREDADAPDNSAVQLMIQAGQERGLSREFRVTPENARYFRMLAKLTEGLPWMLRVVGQRLATTSPKAIVEQWEQSADTLLTVSGRDRRVKKQHRTAHALLQWMWDGLDAKERTALSRLSVFSGSNGFVPEAAAAVIADTDPTSPDAITLFEAPELIITLWEKSALEKVDADESGKLREQPRYRMLSQMLRFCEKELARSGDDEGARRRHLEFYLGLAVNSADEWFGPDELSVLGRLRDEQSNIQTALHTAEKHDPVSGLILLMSLVQTRSIVQEGHIKQSAEWIPRLLKALEERFAEAEPDPKITELVASATAVGGWLAAILGHKEDAKASLSRAGSIAGQRTVPAVLFLQATYEFFTLGRGEDAIPAFERALNAFLESGDRGGAHMVKMFMSLCLAAKARPEVAEPVVDDYLEEAKQAGAKWAISWGEFTQGLYLLRRAQTMDDAASRGRLLADSKSLVDQCCRIWRNLDCRWSPAWGMALEAAILAEKGRHELAARALGASQREQDKLNAEVVGMSGVWNIPHTAMRTCQDSLGQDTFDALFDEGRREIDRVYKMVLTAEINDVLSAREFEIVQALADNDQVRGHTYSEVGARMSLSARTVESHARNAMGKIGVADKKELVDWYRSLFKEGRSGSPTSRGAQGST